MKRPIGTLIAVMAGALPAAAVAQVAPVRLDTGPVRGVPADGVIAYEGIPYAAPPVGPLRWRAPRPAARWTGVREASRYGPDCMQKPFPSDAAPLGTVPAEDCLYANVWRPAGAAKALPVLVWIHGGGFVNGGGSPPTYAGAALAKAGIVFVSFNYRLGRFGTFAHPRLPRAGDGAEADYGYLDQVAALRWVRRNVAAFGGDPARVTIIGESAGGASVHALIASPLAAGLFAQAVIQSGGPGTQPPPTLADADAAGIAFAAGQGIAADDPRAAAKLRALPDERIVDGLNLATTGARPAGPPTFTAPIDSPAFPTGTLDRYAAGRFRHVPLMIGATSDDIGGADGYMANGAARTACLVAARGVPVYRYRFSYVADSARSPTTKGAGHATDIPFFFATQAIKYGPATTPRDDAAGRLASGYLVDFVKRGDPNGPGRPVWRPFTGADPALIDLAADGTAKPETPASACG